MKKILFFLLIALLISSQAWALNCKTSQSGNSDECWTEVRVSNSETSVVIPGTLLMYDFLSSTGDTDSSHYVRVSSAPSNNAYIAGVAQQTIATGDTGLVLVRGMGKVRLEAAAVSSGDDLYPSDTDGTFRTDSGAGSRDKVYAFALEAGSASTTIDAYVTIL